MTSDAHLCLIDGSNMLHRAWAMAPRRQRKSDGTEVGATGLFGQMLLKLIRRMNEGRRPPTGVAIFFDPARENSWRRAIFPAYKAHREDMDADLKVQIPIMQEMCRALGISVASSERHEADDMIGAYAEDAAAAGSFVSIVSTDKDLMQLVRPGVLQVNTMNWTWFNSDRVEERFGVPPSLVGDLLAMAGDSTDGIPGAPGIGPKTAAALLGRFGDLEQVIARSAEIERAGWRKIIEAHVADLRISRVLSGLDTAGCPRPLALSEILAPSSVDAAARFDVWRGAHLA